MEKETSYVFQKTKTHECQSQGQMGLRPSRMQNQLGCSLPGFLVYPAVFVSDVLTLRAEGLEGGNEEPPCGEAETPLSKVTSHLEASQIR